MSITQLIPFVESLPAADKFRLMQFLLSNIAQDKGLPLQDEPEAINRGPHMASILQRMAERHALSAISDPVAWQKEVRVDRTLPGRG